MPRGAARPRPAKAQAAAPSAEAAAANGHPEQQVTVQVAKRKSVSRGSALQAKAARDTDTTAQTNGVVDSTSAGSTRKPSSRKRKTPAPASDHKEVDLFHHDHVPLEELLAKAGSDDGSDAKLNAFVENYALRREFGDTIPADSEALGTGGGEEDGDGSEPLRKKPRINEDPNLSSHVDRFTSRIHQRERIMDIVNRLITDGDRKTALAILHQLSEGEVLYVDSESGDLEDTVDDAELNDAQTAVDGVGDDSGDISGEDDEEDDEEYVNN